MGQCQTDIHIMGLPEKQTEKGEEIFSEEIMRKTSLTWGTKQIFRSRKPRKFQIR